VCSEPPTPCKRVCECVRLWSRARCCACCARARSQAQGGARRTQDGPVGPGGRADKAVHCTVAVRGTERCPAAAAQVRTAAVLAWLRVRAAHAVLVIHAQVCSWRRRRRTLPRNRVAVGARAEGVCGRPCGKAWSLVLTTRRCVTCERSLAVSCRWLRATRRTSQSSSASRRQRSVMRETRYPDGTASLRQ
jgi:hypothetical protein